MYTDYTTHTHVVSHLILPLAYIAYCIYWSCLLHTHFEVFTYCVYGCYTACYLLHVYGIPIACVCYLTLIASVKLKCASLSRSSLINVSKTGPTCPAYTTWKGTTTHPSHSACTIVPNKQPVNYPSTLQAIWNNDNNSWLWPLGQYNHPRP